MFRFTESPPVTLYIHVPWCMRKCPYCDFNSHELKQDLPETAYVDALLSDLEQDMPRVGQRPVESVFIGGGTPSLFSAEAIDRLLSGLRSRVALPDSAEITLEANPGTVEQGKFNEFRATGINRLSIGVQSFQDDYLNRLGRIHTGREAIRAAEAAHDAGFDNFNLDLMFGLPSQTTQDALKDLRNAIDLQPTHISWYQLTLEPNTLFYRHPPTLPEDDALWLMQEQGQDLLAQRGYIQYEVSAYAHEGARCAHNLNYWQFGDYIGIGAGAHGKITDVGTQSIGRLWKCKHPREYLNSAGQLENIGGQTQLDEGDAALEFMMNALRLTDGVAESLFEARTGLGLDQVLDPLRSAQDRELLDWENGTIRPTPRGQRFLNDLLGLFMEEDNGR
jgi:putative oxygen-independent coproporphyrinogen III oxidase